MDWFVGFVSGAFVVLVGVFVFALSDDEPVVTYPDPVNVPYECAEHVVKHMPREDGTFLTCGGVNFVRSK